MTFVPKELKDQSTEELLNSVRNSIWTPAALEAIIDTVLSRLELEKAKQQFTGFDHRYTGGDVISFISSMGLKPEEWKQIKQDLPWLSPDLIEEINEYFLKFPHQA